MTWLFDSHIHLSDSAYLPEIDFILTQMNSLKIKAIKLLKAVQSLQFYCISVCYRH